MDICEVVRKGLPKELTDIIRNYVLQLVQTEKLAKIAKELRIRVHHTTFPDDMESRLLIGRQKIVYTEKSFGGYVNAPFAIIRHPVRVLVAKTYEISMRRHLLKQISYILTFPCCADSYWWDREYFSYFRETWEYNCGGIPE